MACPQALDYLKQIAAALNPAAQGHKGSLAAQFLTYDRGGFKTRMTTNVATVTTAAPMKLLNKAVDRWSWKIINISVNGGYFTITTPDPSSAKGVFLSQNGGNAGVNLKVDGMICEEEVWAINNTADGIWYVIEETLI
jgi:hypothetical protein